MAESEERWRALLDQATDFILDVKPDGKIVFLNWTIAGLPQQATVAESIHGFLKPGDHSIVRSELRKVIEGGGAVSFETADSNRVRGVSKCLTRIGPIKADGKVVAVTLTTKESPAWKGEAS